MTSGEGGDDFEAALRRDLPRGLDKPARAVGRERAVTSRWLSEDEMVGAEWDPKGGLMLGRRSGRIIGWNDDRHLLTIAGSRAGKGVSLIIPNLIFYEGSAVVIDPKGENAARTAHRRGKGARGGGAGLGQEVHVLDPFGESGLTSAAFNPLDKLDARSPDVVEDAGLFADALITHDEKGDRHWTEAAQAVIRALILAVIVDPRFASRRNLVTVRRLLSLSDPSIEEAQKQPGGRKDLTAEEALNRILIAQEDTPFGYICVGMAEQLRAMAEKERGSVLSTARTQTQWLDSPKMLNILERSDFDLDDLKRKKMTVYLCLPAARMATHARWMRLIVLLALGVMERVKQKPDQPVLFVLDEFPVLGYMQSIETAAGLMAGFGVKLWAIMQNIGQLKQHYSSSWETFVANSGVVTAFGVSDSESLKALERGLGQTNIISQTDSGASGTALTAGSSRYREERKTVPLLAEHELRIAFGRKTNRMLVFSVESNPAVVERFTYFTDTLFRGLYDPDPNYGPQR
jgi:type IV secretion system protein VirD4